jgi:hypothetical protein
MNSDQFFNMNFEDALSITALCSDLGISNDDARLFVYIHVKSSAHPLGIQCFTEEREEEILALEIMLGKKDLSVLSSDDMDQNSELSDTLHKFGSFVKDSINELDGIARHGCGRELYFHSELARRLRFHTDKEFRKEKLRIYSTLILPNMKKYGKGKALETFERQRKAPPVLILNFRDSLN